MLDTAPFVFDGAYVDGCLTRISTDALLNVTAGGGSHRADVRRVEQARTRTGGTA